VKAGLSVSASAFLPGRETRGGGGENARNIPSDVIYEYLETP
jgi:hypothetical protein